MTNKGKSLVDLMKAEILERLSAVKIEVIGISEGVSDRKDQDGTVVGTADFVRVSCEVFKKQGELSRVRFDVKIPDGTVKLTEESLEEGTYQVIFSGLEISYIDGNRGQIYFRAQDYTVEEVG